MTTKPELLTWLKSTTSNRVILVEIQGVLREDGTSSTIYLSNKPFTTRSTDTPVSTSYTAAISGGITFSENLSLDGQPSIGFGDIELDNRNNITGGDTWFRWVWTNKAVTILVGDATWPRADFYPIFTGLIRDIDTSGRNNVNLLLVNRLEKLNISLSEAVVGGTSSNKDQLIPLTFGECFNVTPLLVNPATLEYQVHNGPVERIIEVRDNGAPLTGASEPIFDLPNGKFRLSANPYGTITASVQGYEKVGTTYQSRIGSVISNILLNYVTVTPTFSLSSSASTINEGDSVTFTLITTDVNDGVLVPYTITGTSSADIGGASLTGNFTVNNNQATLTLTTTADLLAESAESIILTLTNGSGVSSTVAITDSSRVTFTTAPTSIDEGVSTNYTITLDSPNINTVLYWTILHGTTNGTSDADFTAVNGTLAGGSTTRTFAIVTSEDRVTEGSQNFQIQIRTGSVTGTVIRTSSAITINDTSLNPAATVTANTTAIVEGDSVTFTLVPNFGNGAAADILYWSLDATGTSGNTIGTADFTDGVITGSFANVVKNTSYTVTKQLAVDTATNEIPPVEQFVLNARTGSSTGTIIGTSSVISVTLTQATVTASATSIVEGDSVTFTLVPNFGNGTADLFWTLDGTGLATSDFTDGIISGSFLDVVKNTTYTVTKTLALDGVNDGTKQFALNARTNSITGPIAGTSATVSVTNTSATVTASTLSVNETSGSNTVTFTIVPNFNSGASGSLFWAITGVTGTINSSDFSDANGLSGSILNVTKNTSYTITKTLAADLSTESPAESFRLDVRASSQSADIIGSSQTVSITDTSQTPPTTASFTGTIPSSVSEGSAATFQITTNSAGINTVLYYVVIPGGAATTQDFPALNGLISTTTLTTRNFTVTPTADWVRETNAESFTVEVRQDSTTGQLLATSTPATTITDTSYVQFTTAPLSINETGTAITYTIGLGSTNSATTLYWTIVHGTTTAADFSGSTSGTLASGTTSRSFTITPVADLAETANETFEIHIKTGSISGTTVLNSGTITLNNTSPSPIAIASFTTVPASINEGSAGTFTISTTNGDSATLYYEIVPGGAATSADFSALTALIPTNPSTRTFTITPVADYLRETTAETFTVRIWQDAVTTGTLLVTSSAVTINDTSFVEFSSVTTSINETGTAQNYTINVGTNDTANALYWSILHGTTTAADFSAVNGTIPAAASPRTFSITPLADLTTETAETFQIQIRTGSTAGTVVATSPVITISDTSQSVPSVTIAASPATSSSEGVTVTFTVTTSNISSGTTLFYSISGTNITASDFTDGLLSGSFVTSGTSGSISKTLLIEYANESTEPFTLIVSQTSGGAQLSGGSISYSINNTVALKLSLDASNYTSGTWNDLSGAGNNATLNATNPPKFVAVGTSNTNSYFNFDGINDSITVPNFLYASSTSNLTYTGFTFCVWIMPFTSGQGSDISTGFNGYGRILDKSAGSGASTAPTNGFFLRMSNTSRDISFQISGGATVSSTGNQIPYGRWTHLTVTVTSTGTVNIYKNGGSTPIATGTTSATTSITTTNLLTIGNRSNNTDSTFDGNISLLKYFTTVLSAADALAEYNSTSSRYPITDGIVTSTLRLHADAQNYSTANPTIWPSTSGVAGTDLTLLKNDAAASVPQYRAINAGAFYWNSPNLAGQYAQSSLTNTNFYGIAGTNTATIEGWFYCIRKGITSNIYDNYQFFFGVRDEGDFDMFFQVLDDNNANAALVNTEARLRVNTGVYDINIPYNNFSRWAHVAYVRNGTNLTLYLNGAVASTRTSTTSVFPAATNPFDVGFNKNPFNNWVYNGYISIVRVYSGALTQAQVQQNYNAQRARFGV